MKTITVDCIIDSIIGLPIDGKSKSVSTRNVPIRGIYDINVKSIEDEATLKESVLKCLKMLSIKNNILISGEFNISHNDKLIYKASLFRLSVKNILNGKFITQDNPAIPEGKG